MRFATRAIHTGQESADHVDGYLRVSATPSGRFTVRFPLSLRQLDVSHDGRTLRARCRGDQVVAMEDRGTDLAFFDPYSA